MKLKWLKRTGKIVGYTLLGVVLLLVVIGGMLHTSPVQKIIADKAAGFASGFMDCKVNVDKLDFNLFKRTVTLWNVEVLDRQGNRTVFVSEAVAALKNYNLKAPTLASIALYEPQICIIRYKGDTISDFKRVIQKISALPKKDTALRKAFVIEHGRVFNGRFTYEDQNAGYAREGLIDYKHVELKKVYAEASDFYSRCGKVLFKVRHVECEEKHGFRVNDCSTFGYVNKGELRFTSVCVETPHSKALMDLHLKGNNWPSYKYFIDSVRMEAEVSPSRIYLSDLGYFAPVFRNMPQQVNVDGKVCGLVREMKLSDLHLNMGRHTCLAADCLLTGLPKFVHGAYVDLSLQDFRADAEDLRNLVLPDGTPLALPSALSALRQAEVKGFFQGNLHQFSSELDIQTNVGRVKIGNTACDTADGVPMTAGHILATDIRLDKLFRKDSLLGKVSLDSEFRLNGRELQNLYCHFKGQVSNLEIDRKVVEKIPFHIDWQRDFFRVDMECVDTGLDFNLSGSRKKYRDTSMVVCYIDLRDIDLSPLHLLGDTGSFTFRTRAFADNISYKGKPIQGVLRMNDTEIKRLGSTYRMNYLFSDLKQKDSLERAFYLRSDLLEADLVGQWDIPDLRNAFLTSLTERLPNLGMNLCRNKPLDIKERHIQDFDLRLRLNDADTFLSVFFPKLSLPLGLRMNLRYAALQNIGRMQMAVPYIQWGSLAYLDGYADAMFSDRQVHIETSADRFYLDDSLSMSRFSVNLDKTDTNSNSMRYSLAWGHDGSVSQVTCGDFGGMIHFVSDSSIRLELQDFNLQTEKGEWKSYSDGYVLFSPKSFGFHHVGMFSSVSGEGISIDGTIAHDPASVLDVQFNDFDLSYLEFFMRKIPMKIESMIDGHAQVRDLYGEFSLVAQLKMKNIAINDKLYGQGKLEASFDRSNVLSASFEVNREDTTGNQQPVRPKGRDWADVSANREKTILSMKGKYYPKRQGKLDFSGFVEDFPVNFLDRLLSTVGKDISGNVDGKIELGGHLHSPKLMADVVCRDFALTISMLQTHYAFEKLPVRLSSTEIVFPTSMFVDGMFKTAGNFGGRITHRNFKDIRLDLEVEFNNLLALRTNREANLPFWGTVFATGMLNVEGPVTDILLRVNAQVQENSDISFDFSNPSGGNGANFITFKVPEETVLKDQRISLEKFYAHRRAAQIQKGKITLDFNLDVTPGLAVSVRLRNAAMDGLLTAAGRGALRLHMKNDNPQLFGTYTINGGGFDFSMVNLINKKFKLKEGGTISWLGDVSDPRVDVLAGYQTKASLYPVLAAFDPGNDGRYKQKVNVESIIALSGNLMNPNITFDIDLLNADDDTKDKFWALVQKNNEDEMLQQTFSLLMFNSFMAVESGSSSSVGSSALASSSELLFSQFNNFLSRLTNDFNIGINYKPGSTTSNSEFQVMMSGQLFDDRLVINGNLGVADNVAGTGGANATTVVGDVDVEWKFTEELRLRGFNHSNDEDLTKPVNSYTQGVGIVFRRDFDNLNEFLHGTTPKLTKEERRGARKKNREIRKAKRQGGPVEK